MTQHSTVMLVGPTGFVGQRIFNALLHAREQGKIGKVVAGINYPTQIANADETICLEYKDDQRLMEQLRGIDIVISAVNMTPETAANADKLLVAMAYNNVKLYIPSEYGVDYNKTHYNKIPVFEAKQRHRDYAKQFGFKTIRLYTGLIMEFTFGRLLDLKQLEWKLLSSKQKVAVTALDDLSAVVTQIAATPLDQLKACKDEVYVCSDCRSMHDYARIFEEKTKQPVVLLDQKKEAYEETYTQVQSGKYTGDPLDGFKATIHLIASEGTIDFSENNDDKMFNVEWTSVDKYAASICHACRHLLPILRFLDASSLLLSTTVINSMSDDDIEDFDLDSETLNRIAATEAHFLASQKPMVADSPTNVPSPDDPPPRKLTRRTGPSISNALARSAQGLDIPHAQPPKPQPPFRNPLAVDNHNGGDRSFDVDNKSFGASAQAKSTPIYADPMRASSAAPPPTASRGSSGLAVEIARLRRQYDEEIEKRMQTSNQLNAQYEINYRAQGEIETVRRQALRDQEELKAQREKLRMENTRLLALNGELNKQSQMHNQKMEVDLIFQRYEEESARDTRSRMSTISPQKTPRQPKPRLQGFDFTDSFAAAPPSSHTRSKTAAPFLPPPTPPVHTNGSTRRPQKVVNEGMDWESEKERPTPKTKPTSHAKIVTRGLSSWSDLTQLIFGHVCCYPSISSRAHRQLTLQLILNAPFDEQAPVRDVERYGKASVSMLETFGETVGENDQSAAIERVVKSLNTFVSVFLRCHMLAHLAETLALLASLVYANEGILGYLLDLGSGDGSSLVSSIIELIPAHMKVTKKEDAEGGQDTVKILDDMARDNLSDCVLNLLEIVVLQAQDEYLMKLAPLLKNSEVVQIPLLPDQKWWCVYRWTKVLLFASAHRLLTVSILSQPRSQQVPSAENGYNSSLLSILSGYLTTRHSAMTAIDTHQHLLLILSILHTVSSEDETLLTTLADSKVLIPALIHLLAKDSGMLWNEDSIILYPTEVEYSTEMVVDRMIPTLHLLHKLIILTNQSKLAHKLQNNRPSFHHMCIVSLGRIAFAQCPDFLSDVYKEDVEYLADVGRDLLTLVISPDEGDMVYLTYNSDDEEME